MEALGEFGAKAQLEILSSAAERWNAATYQPPATSSEYVDIAKLGEFEDLDVLYYETKPETVDFLRQLLEAKESEFLAVEP